MTSGLTTGGSQENGTAHLTSNGCLLRMFLIKNLNTSKSKAIHYIIFAYSIHRDNQTVTICRDCTRLSAKSGKQILGIFKSSPNKPNIFEAFEYMDTRENILRYNRDRDPSFSDKPQRDNPRSNYNQQQKRPWKPQTQYKRLNNPSNQKYPPRAFYPNDSGYDTSFPKENSFQDYQYQSDPYAYGGANSYTYNYKGPELNLLGAPANSTSVSTQGYNKSKIYDNNQMGAYTGGNINYNSYPSFNQKTKSTTQHHSLRTASHEFTTGHTEIKDFSEQFIIKKAVPKSPEKKKKPKKSIEDRVSNDFFDNKGLLPNRYPTNPEESDGDQKNGSI